MVTRLLSLLGLNSQFAAKVHLLCRLKTGNMTYSITVNSNCFYYTTLVHLLVLRAEKPAVNILELPCTLNRVCNFLLTIFSLTARIPQKASKLVEIFLLLDLRYADIYLEFR